MVGDKERLEAKLLCANGKSADLVAVPGILTGKEVGGQEDAELQMLSNSLGR